MTKKRFTIVENHKNYLRVDDKTKEKFYLNEREIVECLNNLHDENEQLKQLNIPVNEIKDTVVDYRGRIVGVYYND